MKAGTRPQRVPFGAREDKEPTKVLLAVSLLGPGARVYCGRRRGRRLFMLQVPRRTLSGTEVRLEEARCACKHQLRSRTSATMEGQHRSALSAARSHLGGSRSAAAVCAQSRLWGDGMGDGGRGIGCVCLWRALLLSESRHNAASSKDRYREGWWTCCFLVDSSTKLGLTPPPCRH